MTHSEQFFSDFRAGIEQGDALAEIRAGIIGKDIMIPGSDGPKPMLYADYVASGRALRQIEEAVLNGVLPYYANSHTEDSYCGAYMTGLRASARAVVADLCGAGDAHSVIFTGSGATAGLNRLVHLFGVREAIAEGRGATIIIGPYEHHSNILPWRESGARVIEIPEAPSGGPDLGALKSALSAAKGLVIGSFSAASNVTGIMTDIATVTRMLKSAGALAVWDYAGGGPYMAMSMQPGAGAEIDAIVISPHKFIGGPAASGLLILRKDAVATQIPTCPGGGTVLYVSSTEHDYVADISEREEAGTPNTIGDIRAALALIVKDVIGQHRIDRINAEFARRMLQDLAEIPGIAVLGNTGCARLPIFSFLVARADGSFVEPQEVARVLSDRFGIQVRGGCACAGPYGHHLLSIPKEVSGYLRARILQGDLSEKPGFVRFNLSYLFTPQDYATLLRALQQLPGLFAETAWQGASVDADPASLRTSA